MNIIKRWQRCDRHLCLSGIYFQANERLIQKTKLIEIFHLVHCVEKRTTVIIDFSMATDQWLKVSTSSNKFDYLHIIDFNSCAFCSLGASYWKIGIGLFFFLHTRTQTLN